MFWFQGLCLEKERVGDFLSLIDFYDIHLFQSDILNSIQQAF